MLYLGIFLLVLAAEAFGILMYFNRQVEAFTLLGITLVLTVLTAILVFIWKHPLSFVVLGGIALLFSATFALTVYIRDSFRQKHGFCYYLAARSDMLRRTRAMYSTLDRICKHCTDSSVQDLAIYTQKGVRSLHIQIRQLTKSDQGTAAVLAKLEKYEKETERLEKLYIDHMLSLVPGIPKQI